MDRRSFLKNSALGGASVAAASTLAAPAYAQGKRKLTMVTSWGRGLAGVFDSAQYCADQINAMSDGSLEVEIKAAGELVGAFEVFDAVSSGQADMYHAADYYFINQHPAYAFFTSVPFGMTAQELMNWYYYGDGGKFHDELGEIFNLKSFISGNTGPQAGGWFEDPGPGIFIVYISGSPMLCCPIYLKHNSPDINGDLIVNLIDVSLFAQGYFSDYSFRIDLRYDGVINLADLSLFAQGMGAACP